MKKFAKKGVLLFAGVMAVCAFAMPAMSSAASWGVIGTEHTLDSGNLGFTTTHPILGAISSSCGQATFTADVRSAAALTVTGAVLNNCTIQGAVIGDCTMTSVATTLPWTATGPTTSNVQIHDIRFDMKIETRPGSSLGLCKGGLHSQSLVWTGTLSGGVWNAAQSSVTYTNAEGVVWHDAFGITIPVTMSGTIRDTNGLTLT